MPNNSDNSKTKLGRLYDLLCEIAVEARPNLAILAPNEFLFSYKDRLSYSRFVADAGPATGLRPERGSIMDFFVQIEVLVNQILVVKIIGNGGEVQRFEQVLDAVDLFSKIRLLNEWGLVDNRSKEKLICLKEVRNGYAHNWDTRKISYKGKPVLQNFERFKVDAAEAFEKLIKLYNGGEIDIDKLSEQMASTAKKSMPSVS